MSSYNTTSIEIRLETMEKLKRLAQPFTDTPDSVISKLIDYYEIGNTDKPKEKDKYYKTKSGIKIPLGTIVGKYRPRGSDKPYFVEAHITEKGINIDGIIFDDPSPAAKHAKKSLGSRDSAASTNGWNFWSYYDKEKNRNIKLDEFRKTAKYESLTLEDIGL